jgi:DNA modification methylase
MHIESISIERINPAAYNPRIDLRPGDPEYDKLQRSLDEFGFVEPLVWNRRSGNLVGGHQRLKILLAKGVQCIEVSVVDLPPERERALNVALNKVGGDWDERKLADLLTGLSHIPDFDVGLTGFDTTEITHLLDRLEALDGEDDFDLAAALEAAEGQPAVTAPGDLFELGRHRLLCGDAAKSEDLARLLEGTQVDLVFTDPPYNVNYYGGNRPTPRASRPKPSRSWGRIYMDDLDQDAYEEWLGGVLRNMLAAMAPGAPFYVWNGHRQFGPMHTLLTAQGAHVSCVIVWAKENFAIGYGDYSQQTEFCLYGWRSRRPRDRSTAAHRWYGPTNESTLWQVHRDRTKEYRHPTQKPLALAERALRNSSRRDECVLDLFLGSGSTLIAAERLSRRCLGMEIDPRYCDAIVRRYLALVGNQAPDHLLERYGMPGDGHLMHQTAEAAT